jgi:hypothetical protein
VKTGGFSSGSLFVTNGVQFNSYRNCDLKTDADGSFSCGTDATGGGGDNLGNHSATMALSMNNWDINNVGILNVGTKVNTPQICLNGDCKSAWPSGGGGIASIKSGSCGVGQVVKSITADGTVTCGGFTKTIIVPNGPTPGTDGPYGPNLGNFTGDRACQSIGGACTFTIFFQGSDGSQFIDACTSRNPIVYCLVP